MLSFISPVLFSSVVCLFEWYSLTLSWLSISRAAFRTYRSILSNVAGYFKIVWASFISITFSVASSSSRRLKGRTRTATLILSDIFGESERCWGRSGRGGSGAELSSRTKYCVINTLNQRGSDFFFLRLETFRIFDFFFLK